MKKTLRFLLLALLVPLFLQSAKPAAAAEWWVGIHVGFGPPALPVYELPVCPGPDYIWTPGYWAWDPTDGYYWVPGTWIVSPEAGFLWTPGWWGWETGGYFWHEGYWGPHVGFYGGINYGFGYWGDGFWGGRWQGGHFFYNTAVLNVGGGFHNVYRDETVIHNTTIINNHISYNGGQGGIDRHPTPEEDSYANERHVGPVSEQSHQVEVAHSNPQLRASVNQGRPAIAATSRAGEFSGHGVVQTREAGGEYHAPPAEHAEPAEHAAPGGEASQPGNAAHAKDLPQHQPAQVPSTGNANLDKKYQQQQQQLADRQNQEHQQLQQRQEQEHQQAQQHNFNTQKQQQMEQKHQQQTQKLEQKHTQQTQRLTQRQSGGRGRK
jgi:WXXGXW repeat (2 copies)